MLSTLTVWFRSFIRPRVSTVQVILYENHQEKDIATSHLSKQELLMKEIQDLWKVPPSAPYWFEAEVRNAHSCWKKQPPKLYVVCYQEKELDPTRKREADIPNRYRTKMFNRYHKLSLKNNIEVKFILVQ